MIATGQLLGVRPARGVAKFADSSKSDALPIDFRFLLLE